ncbi:MAG: Ig-like domain-containing protein [Aigarchaeota archaeon]|nr:Ig-like domain-containing protein [Aigarchaeota archaeon]MCX8193545.1 Ig-like domain-containing protein [Nitrososphaeria archaeon]MDW7986685.1 Ig-like domain-containing protein [Nitrososphaerota archaeon]
MKLKILSLMILILSASAFTTVFEASAQPTWNLKIIILPSELYMGEWGKVYVNITNMDCSARENFFVELKSVSEKVVNELVKRAEEMEKMEWIRGYDLKVKNLWGYAGDRYGDYSLTVFDSCTGSKIDIVGVGLWFPFQEIGRRMTFWNTSKRTLEAFNPINYILHGVDPKSSTILSFRVYIPEDIPSEEISMKPIVDVRVILPGWFEYTLESYPVAENRVDILPYRTFNLTITDFDGLNPVPNAKVIITRLMYYYEKREYITPENGTLKIHRLYDDKYEVAVYWNSSYTQEYPFIQFEQHWAYDLARSKILKTSLFTLRIKPIDVYGRPLNRALVMFDGFEKIAENGEAVYLMVPQGNHTAQIFWKGVKVFDGWLWTGYHPTIYPWMTRPAVEHVLKLPVGDLIVQAVDTGGNSVGANFTVIGPNLETSFGNIYSRTGLLNISQLPILDYNIRVVNYSKLFKNLVEHTDVFRPGEKRFIQLPIHSVKLKVESMTGRPVADVILRLGPASSRTGEGGYTVFSGVPRDEYEVLGEWLGIEVYRGKIVVEGSMEKVLRAVIYDINIRLIDYNGKEYPANYTFLDPLGRMFKDKAVKNLRIEYVPEGLCKLVITDISVGRELLNKTMKTKELYEISEIVLPVADMKIDVKWSDGKPVEKAEIEVVDLAGGSMNAFTDHNGTALLEKQFFSNYRVTIYHPYTKLVVISQETEFKGQILRYSLEKAFVTVRVVDLLGNPIQGAEVYLSHFGVLLSNQKTDQNGIAFFKDVVKLPLYDAYVSSRGLSGSERVGPGGSIEIKLDYVSLAGLGLSISDILGIAVLAISIIIIIVIVVLVRRSIRRILRKT